MTSDLPKAHIHVPRDDQAYAAEVGLRNLVERDILTLSGETYSVNPQNSELVEYYANSIRHLMPGSTADDLGDSAPAKEISAPAGS